MDRFSQQASEALDALFTTWWTLIVVRRSVCRSPRRRDGNPSNRTWYIGFAATGLRCDPRGFEASVGVVALSAMSVGVRFIHQLSSISFWLAVLCHNPAILNNLKMNGIAQ